MLDQWQRRHRGEGPEGLRHRSHKPHTGPQVTPGGTVEKIIHLRANYHFGRIKSAMYFKRHPDFRVSDSGLWRVLKWQGMARLPASQRYERRDLQWERYEKEIVGPQGLRGLTTTRRPPGPQAPRTRRCRRF